MRLIKKLITYSLFTLLLLGPISISAGPITTSEQSATTTLQVSNDYHTAYADPTAGTPPAPASPATTPYSSATYLNELASLLTTGFKVLQQVLWPVLLLIGPLLDNSLIFGPGVEDRLFDVWMQIRDITNFILAIMLVAVALYNLAGLGEGGNYELKSFFKKFVLALVLINFSFFGARLVLDAANLLTSYTFSLPNSFEVGVLRSQAKVEEALCQSIREVTQGKNQAQDIGDFSLFGAFGSDSPESFCESGSLTQNGRAFFSKVSSNNLPLIMASNYSNIADGLEPSRTFALTKDITNLAINTIISTALVLMHALAFFSLFAILIVRLIFMWLAIALSPLVVFATIMGISAFEEVKKLFDEFFALAFAPAKVGFALSISYILFSAIEQNGLANPGIALGQPFAYPFSGVGSLEKLIISISSIVIVYEVALNVGAGTRASFFTNKISALARSQTDLAGRWLKKVPLGVGSRNSAITLGSLGQSYRNLENAIAPREGSTRVNHREIRRAISSPTGTNFVLQDATNFVDNYTNRAYRDLTVQQVTTRLGDFTADTKVNNFLTNVNRLRLPADTPWSTVQRNAGLAPPSRP